MHKRILPLALVSVLASAAAFLQVRGRGRTRESLLPALRSVEQHGQQLDRAVGRLMPLPVEEERAIGERIDARLAALDAAAGGAADPAEGLVQELGRPLSRSRGAVRFRDRYVFRVLRRDASVNAFAVPGGYVYVTSGLLTRFQGHEDALRFVLGHEIGHVELGHCADAYRTQAWFDRLGLEGLGDLAGFARLLAAQSFSRNQELEADLYGLRLLQAGGGDPRAALAAMDLLGLTADVRTRRHPGEVAVEGLSDYFHTHPGSWERRAQLEHERGPR